MYLIGFDPGRDKCGIALVTDKKQVLLHEVVTAANALPRLQQLRTQYVITQIVLGDQTSSKQWQQALQTQFPDLPIIQVDERYSSLEARDRYWQYYPPRGLQQLVPTGMRTPPRPIDDLVAIILVERFLSQPA
ncbi:MAG: pre-16S rRNA-processing nuclease YqgF [Synechococcales bacterium]|nr:pre-16S rRNA-processing nuclease YqgF [Synechococcales bacterium]